MNDHKFAFIICTNNEIYLQECIYYLNLLIIPDGYDIEILTIEDAKSMTAGYNEGMASTDAKYKIYMHQDVFIINRNFLSDILTIFQSDLSIGLIGMIGYTSISPNGLMWYAPQAGAVPCYGSRNNAYPHLDCSTYRYSFENNGITDVALIDGLMMITAYDLPWNETDLKDFDFYDTFQSMEFLLNNYRIVVPNQTSPWYVHDDGRYLSLWNYDKYRRIFLSKYKEHLGKTIEQFRK